MGARPSHAEWQGKVFSRSGDNPKYPDFETSTGYGTGAGLCGWNCRHNFHAYFEGAPRAYTDEMLDKYNNATVEFDGNKIPYYEATQKQRAYERNIRLYKRTLAGQNSALKELKDKDSIAEMKEAMRWDSVGLKREEYKLKRFCKQTGLRVDSSRAQVKAVKTDDGRIVGFDRSAATRARAIAEKHHKDWVKSIGAEGTPLDKLEKYYEGKYNKSDEYIRLKRLNGDKKLLDAIRTKFNLNIHWGRQGKHILGHNNYRGGSYLKEGVNPQKLVNKYAGTGKVKRDGRGRWAKKQFFTHSEPIGLVQDQSTGEWFETSRFSVSYSKKGTHIVPRIKRIEDDD